MSEERFKLVGAIFVLLIKEDKVFLIRRAHTGWKDGHYSLIGGHLDGNEPATVAAAREAQEEAGVKIQLEDLKFFNVAHLITNSEKVHFSFYAEKWEGEARNNELSKADDAGWFSIDNLPENTTEVVREVIRCYKESIQYSEFGWPSN